MTTITPGALLPLFVAVPLIASAIEVIIPWGIVQRKLGIIIPALSVAASVYLLFYLNSTDTKVIASNIGNYPGGVAIPFAADIFCAVMLITTGLVATASNWFADVVGETKARFYPSLTLMLIAGVNGALLTADLFNLFVFIEVMLLPSYGLLAMTGTWARLASVRMFVIVNLITSLFLLLGVVFIYAVIGTTNLAALAGAAGPRGHAFVVHSDGARGPLIIALGILLMALCVKGAVVPVHTWLPRSYPSASPAVMSLFSGLHTKVAVYAIIRIYMVVFEGDSTWAPIITVLMIAGLLVGSFGGLAERSLRTVLAYQMINGVPFYLMALAFLAGNPVGMLGASLFYMIHSMIVTSSLILSSGAIEETYATGRFNVLHGLYRRDPFVSLVFAAGALAIVGLPPFSGLWGKLGVVFNVAQSKNTWAWVMIAVIVAASIAALYTMLRLWRDVFWGHPMDSKKIDPDLAVRPRFVFPSLSLIVVSFAMFLGAGPVFSTTQDAANGLVDTTNYVHAVLDDPDEAIAVVIPSEHSGMLYAEGED